MEQFILNAPLMLGAIVPFIVSIILFCLSILWGELAKTRKGVRNAVAAMKFTGVASAIAFTVMLASFTVAVMEGK